MLCSGVLPYYYEADVTNKNEKLLYFNKLAILMASLWFYYEL